MPFYSDPLVRVINFSEEKYFILAFAFSFTLPNDVEAHGAIPCAPIDWPGPPSFPEIDGNAYEAVTPGGGVLDMLPNASSTGIVVTMSPTPEGEEAETREVHAISGVPTSLPAEFVFAPLQHGFLEGVQPAEGGGVFVSVNVRGAATRKVESGGTMLYTGTVPVDEENTPWMTPMTATVSSFLRQIDGEICRFNPDTEDPLDGIKWLSFQGDRVVENSVSLDFSAIRIELKDEDGQPDGAIWRPVAIYVPPLISNDSYDTATSVLEYDVGGGVQLLMQQE